MKRQDDREKVRAPRESRDRPCHFDYSATYDTKDEKAAASQWILELDVPAENPLGSCYMYRQFEFSAVDSPYGLDLDALTDDCLAPYLSISDADGQPLPTARLNFVQEENKVLAKICAQPCTYREEWEKSRCKETLTCREGFTKGFHASFSLDLSRIRELRADKAPETKSIFIHDIRLLGHPLIVELKYTDVQNPQQRKRLHALSCCYPGSGKNTTKYSARLGGRINEALSHHIKKVLIAEGSALSIDVINRWADREKRLASQALPKTTALYNMAHCTDFTTVSMMHNIRVRSGSGRINSQNHRIVCRKEIGSPLRLLAIYTESDWKLVELLVSGAYSQYNWTFAPKAPIPPEQLFNLAVDYLSAPENDLLCNAKSASPVLGAMLFLVSYPRDQVEAMLLENDSYTAEYYLTCYEKLAFIYERYSSKSFPIVSEALPLLRDSVRHIHSEFEQDILYWRWECEFLAGKYGLILPRCSQTPYVPSSEEKLLLDPIIHPPKFPLPSGIKSFSEFVTRLLLFNPATLSQVRSETGGQARYVRRTLRPAGDPHGFQCAIREDGTLNYRYVVPGIKLNELQNLLDQGFLTEERITPFRRHHQ